MTAARWSLVLLVAAGTVACKHAPTAKEQQGAQIHYDLGLQAQQAGDVQSAYKEFQSALELDPGFPDAYNAEGILLHLAFHRPEEAIRQFQKALEIRPTFSEVKTNLGNVYLDQGHYAEAIHLYEEALNDMLYPTPYIAQGNLGWALYKKGDVPQALDHLKAAVTLNPKFCLGYKNLGILYDEQGKTQASCEQLARYAERCPEVPDASYRYGICLGKLGEPEKAKGQFAACQTKAAKAQNDELKDDCMRLQEKLP